MSNSVKAENFLVEKLKVREAREDDLLLIYHWNNDPAVRSNSFKSNPIPLEDHTNWFIERLKDDSCKIYIVEASKIPAAQIRFSVVDELATISYLVASEFRGRGIGHTVLLKGVEKLKEDLPYITQIEGLVRHNNIPSIRAFEKAGFNYDESDVKQPQALRFVKMLAHSEV